MVNLPKNRFTKKETIIEIKAPEQGAFILS